MVALDCWKIWIYLCIKDESFARHTIKKDYGELIISFCFCSWLKKRLCNKFNFCQFQGFCITTYAHLFFCLTERVNEHLSYFNHDVLYRPVLVVHLYLFHSGKGVHTSDQFAEYCVFTIKLFARAECDETVT